MKISVGRYGSNSHQIALALSPAFWQEAQAKIRADHVEDFFPYPEELRFADSRPRRPTRRLSKAPPSLFKDKQSMK
ncbi:MAG: hypothetical protein FWD50_05280 [Betaproteobacteria bacterium]|nr:hypothetical protein [Betaproteobacteria bacterium]